MKRSFIYHFTIRKMKANSDFNHYRAYIQHKREFQIMLCINFESRNFLSSLVAVLPRKLPCRRWRWATQREMLGMIISIYSFRCWTYERINWKTPSSHRAYVLVQRISFKKWSIQYGRRERASEDSEARGSIVCLYGPLGKWLGFEN